MKKSGAILSKGTPLAPGHHSTAGIAAASVAARTTHPFHTHNHPPKAFERGEHICMHAEEYIIRNITSPCRLLGEFYEDEKEPLYKSVRKELSEDELDSFNRTLGYLVKPKNK